MRKFEKIIDIPIYHVKVMIVVCDSISVSYKDYEDLFGKEFVSDADGLCVCSVNGLFGLFFEKAALNHNLIAHELYHLVNRILSYHNVEQDFENDEQSALLNGYLAEQIYRYIGKFL